MKKTLERRLEAFRKAIDQGHLRGLVLNQSAHIFHLTGWHPPNFTNVFAVVGINHFILVSPFIPDEMPPVCTSSTTYVSFSLDETVVASRNAISALHQALSQANLIGQSVGVVLDTLPGAYALSLSKLVKLQDANDLVQEVTTIKDEMAQQAIRNRVAFLDQAFRIAGATIQPGVTEIEVFGAIFTSLARSLEGPLTLDCNFASGSRTLADEPGPTNKCIESGETVLIDLFPILGGYGADYTRNFVVGKATDAQLEQHAVLEKALSTAQSALRPGIAASEVDRIVRGVIEEKGYGKYIHQHHSGHAFGLAIPEPPRLISADHTPLRKGMVIAVEPGIYHPANGGMRLEGNYIITEDGCESLAGFPAILTICA
jgi:Xaa-Pro dipeptidase